MLQRRAEVRWLGSAILLAILAVGCGGGNDGTVVERSTVAIRGVVDDGTPTSPVANARCRVLDLEGRVLHSATANAQGEFVLLADPGERGVLACAPPNQAALELRAFFSTVGLPPGGDLSDQLVLPATTVVAWLVAQEFSDGRVSDPVARRDALMGAIDTDADLGLLTATATMLFNALRGGANADFEALFMDLVDDSVLDAAAFEALAEEIDAAVAELEAEFGRTLRAAFLARFPPFDLSVLHHSGGAGALLDAGPGLENFGGVARFATVVDDTRFAARTFGPTILLSGGDQITPSLLRQASIDRQNGDYDADAMARLGYAGMGLGPRDLALSPVGLGSFLSAFSPIVPMITSTVDLSGEQNLLAPIAADRLPPVRVVEIGGRRVGLVSATRPDMRTVSSPRSMAFAPADELVTVVQNQVDAVTAAGARVVILLSHQADLEADRALAEQLRDVDVVIAAGGHSLLANEGDLLIPGDEDRVAGAYPQWATDQDGVDVPLVSTAGRYRYLGRLDVSLDPLGLLLGVDALNSGPIRVAGSGTPDGVVADAGMVAEVIEPLLAAVETLRGNEAAQVQVPLDATAENLRSRETNFGDLVADALVALARSQAQGFNAGNATAAVVDAGAVLIDEVIADGRVIRRADVYDLLDADRTLTVMSNVSATQLKRLLEWSLANVGGPEFLQLAGLRLEWDPNGTAQELDEEGEVVTAGTRVRQLRIIGGAVLVEDGAVRENAPNIALATTDRLAQGLLGNPVVGANRVNIGLSLPQALDRYLVEALQRRVRSNDFPVEGRQRIIRLSGG
ncbi:MAG: 5'-nucleotidase C-terminal domain-containing protein [Gammaproteobacteria bacterium]|nr:5'-nucleotidase C-terminal domain-containing protein [Gammaproteobacteria bacterium]